MLDGFSKGFSLGFAGAISNTRSDNLKSAKIAAEIVSEKLRKEKELGRVAGPFHEPPFNPFHVSPIGLVEKKEPNSYRLIHHLSFPKGLSINDAIPRELSSIQYESIQNAIQSILACGDSCFLAKADLKSAFRQIPVTPAEYPLLGFSWQGHFWYDRCLPMGAASSCAIFSRVSSALVWISLRFMPGVTICKVLDDFLFISNNKTSTAAALNTFQKICSTTGFPIAHEKSMGPAKVIPFLGITLDTVKKEARLPPEKLEKCAAAIRHILGKHSVRLRELQSILGLLNFACSVVVPGRAFLRRLHDLTIGIKESYHYIRLKKEAKEDLRLWLTFLDNYNGKSFFLTPTIQSSDSLRFFTDASAAIGYGAVFKTSWFQGRWPEPWKAFPITVLEFFPIVVACMVWGDKLANKRVEFMTDNEALVSIINKQTSKNGQVMYLLRKLVLCCLEKNISFSCVWLPGKRNIIADALSRFQMERFRQFASWAEQEPHQLPAELTPACMHDMPGT